MTPLRLPMLLSVALLASTLLASPLAVRAQEDAEIVKVDAATQRRLGIITAPLTAARRDASVHGFARVLDPVPLATLDSDLTAAIAAASASNAEAARTKALFAADATVSAKVAQAAAAQAQADNTKVALLRRRLGLEWGPSFARMPDAARARLVTALAYGQASLLRLDVAGPPPAGVRTVDINLGASGVVRATVLGPARVGDARLQSTGLLAQVSGPAAAKLGSGMTAPVSLPVGAGSAGVILPRSALLRTGGQTTVYIRKDAGSFERRPVVGGISDPAGLFASQGFRPGEVVVTQGASALFAAQTPAEPE